MLYIYNPTPFVADESGIKIMTCASYFSCSEKQRLKLLVGGLVWFAPTESELFFHRDGGVAIIDQWIASHGKYFIGMTLLFTSYQFIRNYSCMI